MENKWDGEHAKHLGISISLARQTVTVTGDLHVEQCTAESLKKDQGVWRTMTQNGLG